MKSFGLSVLCILSWTTVADVTGLITPNNSATLSAFQQGVISQIHVELGSTTKQDSPLVSFECELPKIELAMAKSQADGAGLTNKNNQRLYELQAIGRETLALSQVELARTQAELERAQYISSRCVINAPFNGVVQSIDVKQHEFVEANTPLITLLDVSQLKVEFLLSDALITQYDVGDVVKVVLPTQDKTYQATITHLAPSIDAVSQTRFAEAVVDASVEDLLPGTSVRVMF